MSTLMSFVSELLVTVAAGAAFLVAATSAGLVAARRRVRISRGRATGAPARWLVVPSRASLLHRRLRRAMRGLRVTIPAPKRRREPTPVQRLAADLESLAVSIDRDVVAARWQPMALRHRSLTAAAEAVRGVEQLTARLMSISSDLDGVAGPGGNAGVAQARLEQLAEAIVAFEQALDDLAPVDLAAPFGAGFGVGDATGSRADVDSRFGADFGAGFGRAANVDVETDSTLDLRRPTDAGRPGATATASA